MSNPDFNYADFNPVDFPVNTPAFQPRASLYGDIPVLGPVGVAVTGISTSPVLALGADSVRHGVLFHNPNPAALLRIFPAGQMPTPGAGGIVIEPLSFFEIYESRASLVRVISPWAVVADVAGAFGLTIWNFTDSNQAVAAPERVAHINVHLDIPSPNCIQTSALTTASSTLLGPNQNRRGIDFHNPGTQNKAVSPANLPASMGAGSIILLPKATKQFRAVGKVRVNCGFNAATANAVDGTLTALEFV